jgi:hypothetical protein
MEQNELLILQQACRMARFTMHGYNIQLSINILLYTIFVVSYSFLIYYYNIIYIISFHFSWRLKY